MRKLDEQYDVLHDQLAKGQNLKYSEACLALPYVGTALGFARILEPRWWKEAEKKLEHATYVSLSYEQMLWVDG